MHYLSQRLSQLQPSPTLAVTAQFKAMKAAGKPVIGFGAGEPDFDTPGVIKEAAIQALQNGATKYSPTPGTPEARQAIAEFYSQHLKLPYTSENVVISVGGKHSLYLTFMGTIDPGDEVIIPAPFWVSYPEQVKLAQGCPVIVTTDEQSGFKLTANQLKQAITPKTRALILNSPNNPTGAVYTKKELEQLADVLREYPDILIYSDDIYDRLVYSTEAWHSILHVAPDLQQRTIVLNGLSKSLAMTGWRVGFTLAPASLAKALGSLQGQMTSSIPSFILAAIPTALTKTHSEVDAMRQAFSQRRDLMVELLTAIPGITLDQPQGAFYCFPNIASYFGKTSPAGTVINTAQDFASSLLEEVLVAVVPGEGFGAPNNIRLSYATSEDNIRKGLKRVHEYCSQLR